MGDCIHDFVQRSGGLQRSECFACLRARLEETERERDAKEEALEVARGSIVRLHADAEAAEAALEKAREALAAIHADYAQDATEDPIGHRDRLPYVRMHLTPVSGAIDALRAISKARPCSVQPDEHHFLPGATVCTCRLRVHSPEPLRTEGAPKHRGHIVCGSLGAEPCLVEGAPKQEEADPDAERKRGGLVAGLAGNIERARAERDALRARVSHLEKKLQFIADCGFDEDIDWRAFARAALAPEAPVEKENRVMSARRWTTKVRDYVPGEGLPKEICRHEWHDHGKHWSRPLPGGVYRTECPECCQWGVFYVPTESRPTPTKEDE